MADPVQIVSPDGPLPSIVTSGRKSDQNAAADLCNYLSRITGRTIAPSTAESASGVVIHVGLDAFAKEHAPEVDKLFADGYIIKCVTERGQLHIILAGKQAVSATWAVEQFLRDIGGVRFLFPDAKYGEVVPSRPVLTIESDFNRSFEPHYVSRYATTKSGHAYYTPSKEYLRGRTKWYGYGEHAIQFLFSEPEFKAHPEWFAFFNGKRQWWSYGNGWQICTSNPGTVQHAAKCAIEFFDKNPDVPAFSVGLNDGSGWCECPDCSKFVNSFSPPYSLSDRWFHWVNQVAKEVGKKYPDKWIESMAYAMVSAPPRFAMEPNVAVTVTIVVPENLKEAEQWTKICKSVNLYSYMYGMSFLGFRHYPHAAKDFLKWGHDNLGALAHITESGGDWTFDGPKFAYVNALQWDVNTDVDALMADYCTSSYGVAAAPMKAFWDRLEKIYERRDARDRMAFYVWVGWQQAFNVTPNHELKDYTLEDVEALDALIEQAIKLTSTGDLATRFRVTRLAEAWRYFRTTVLSKLKYNDLPLPGKIATESQLNDLVEQARQIAELRAQRSTALNQMRLFPDLNPNLADKAYWGSFTGLTLFNRELTQLDATASQISQYLREEKKNPTDFWTRIVPGEPLFETAQTQLAGDKQPAPENLLANGGFEATEIVEWEAEGGSVTVSNSARSGKHAALLQGSGEAALSRKFSVRDRERYRLEGWARPVGEVPSVPVTLDSIIEFYSNGQRIWYTEPVRNVPYGKDLNGWSEVQSTFDVPPGADTAIVKLRKQYDGGSTLWDDLSLKLVRQGVGNSGTLADEFSTPALDDRIWFQTISSGGAFPSVVDGRVAFQSDRCPIASYATFPFLINDRVPAKARLKVQAVPAASSGSRYFKWGFQSGAGSVGTMDGTGIWCNQEFDAEGKLAQLMIYAHQNGKVVGSIIKDIPPPKNPARETWLTMVVDASKVELFVSGSEFSESESCLVASTAHGITDWLANGSPRFKMEGAGSGVDLMEVASPEGMRDHGGKVIQRDPSDRNNAIIPGGVAK